MSTSAEMKMCLHRRADKGAPGGERIGLALQRRRAGRLGEPEAAAVAVRPGLGPHRRRAMDRRSA